MGDRRERRVQLGGGGRRLGCRVHEQTADPGLGALTRHPLDVGGRHHDEAEVDRALAAGADLVGVNQRDLTTFTVDTSRATALAARLPGSVVRVAESGIGGPDDIPALAEAGYDAVLVGESLVTAADPEAATAALVAPGLRGLNGEAEPRHDAATGDR